MDHLRFTNTARLLHWGMALLLLLTLPAGLIMTRSDIGRDLQNVLFIYHKNVGVLLFVLVLLRLWVRLRHPPPPRQAVMPHWQARAALLTHRLLYVLLLLLPIAGYLRVRADGYPVEMLDAIGAPILVPLSESLADAAKTVHHWAGRVMLALVAVHVGAAAHHGLIRRDGTFGRMWPPFGGGSS